MKNVINIIEHIKNDTQIGRRSSYIFSDFGISKNIITCLQNERIKNDAIKLNKDNKIFFDDIMQLDHKNRNQKGD